MGGKWGSQTTSFCPKCKRYRHNQTGQHARTHRLADQILKMLTDPLLTFQDAADEFGLSREYVRQLLKEYGRLTGKDRIKDRYLRKLFLQEEVLFNEKPLLLELKLLCEIKRINFQLIPISGGDSVRWNSQDVLLNGHLCLVGPLTTHILGYLHKEYLNVRSSTIVEFQVRKARSGSWWVFKNDELPIQTSFSEFPRPNFGTHHTRHDYIAKYKEAWHLLS